MPSCYSPVVGLGLGGPFILQVLTAPAERIKLLLQTQDEIILNLREESLAAYSHHHQAQSSAAAAAQPSTSDQRENENNQAPLAQENAAEDGDEDEEDDEPRSIIVPYAQLPYTDPQDCALRLLEKEGARSLWRGYGLETARLVLQTGIETTLRRKRFMSVFDLRRWVSSTSSMETFSGSAAWIFSTAVEGTIVSAVALLAVYPLAMLQTKMATDVVRKMRTTSHKKVSQISSDTHLKQNLKGEEIQTSESMEASIGSEVDSVEWIEHTEEHQVQAKDHSYADATNHSSEPVVVAVSSPSPSKDHEHVLAYKYRNSYDALLSTVDFTSSTLSTFFKSFLGLYDGFSTVLLSTFISRIGFLTLYRVVSPMLIRSSSRGGSGNGAGAFVLVFGVTTLVNMLVYPLSTVCHRRMIAAPGRYSSSCDAAKQIVQKQGWKALYKGWEVALVRSAVLGVLTRFLY